MGKFSPGNGEIGQFSWCFWFWPFLVLCFRCFSALTQNLGAVARHHMQKNFLIVLDLYFHREMVYMNGNERNKKFVQGQIGQFSKFLVFTTVFACCRIWTTTTTTTRGRTTKQALNPSSSTSSRVNIYKVGGTSFDDSSTHQGAQLSPKLDLLHNKMGENIGHFSAPISTSNSEIPPRWKPSVDALMLRVLDVVDPCHEPYQLLETPLHWKNHPGLAAGLY
jgi:hypothetical protein